MEDRATRLPNIDPGHIEGCTTRAFYPRIGNVPPMLVVITCADGCPHNSVELR